MNACSDQLGFDALLQSAETENATRQFDHEVAHLPADMAAAIAFHRDQIAAHHEAMLASDFEKALAIREEAHLLARKLNGGRHGIIAHDDAPGCVLAKACAAPNGAVPLWGQDGMFTTCAAGMEMQVTMGGMFGIGATAMPYLGFCVRSVDKSQPFLSDTGFRSFLGASLPPQKGRTPEGFARDVVQEHVRAQLKGRLVLIHPDWRGRHAELW